MSEGLIQTAEMSSRLRARAIDVEGREVLISRLAGSEQEVDLTEPPNCDGYGRIRHFKLKTSDGWPANPLPIIPARKALKLGPVDAMTAQVFQNAACPWRCWYCFVPFNLLSADPKRGAWLSADELVALYAKEGSRPHMIDLSGGSPDLVPEWTVWMMDALERQGLADQVYLWTDDNLSSFYLFEHLSTAAIDRMLRYRAYGRVCCFKGFDEVSFSFNTTASQDGFDRQFEVMRRVLETGLDLYGYVTLTAPPTRDIDGAMARFVDRLQGLHENLPLRVIPLEIRTFTPTAGRMNDLRVEALNVQNAAIAAWNRELSTRFSPELRSRDIAEVPMGSLGGVA